MNGDWREQAACATEGDPELFFADASDNVGIESAKAICRRCPVTEQCIREAVDTDERWGIRGGLTAAERNGQARNDRPNLDAEILALAKAGHRNTTIARELGITYHQVAAGIKRLQRHGHQPRESRRKTLTGRTHGLYGTYSAGCRCDVCSTAASLYRRTRREMQQAEEAVA